jgi:hypothetical protein
VVVYVPGALTKHGTHYWPRPDYPYYDPTTPVPGVLTTHGTHHCLKSHVASIQLWCSYVSKFVKCTPDYSLLCRRRVVITVLMALPTDLPNTHSFRKWHTCNYEWYRLYRSYENCRRPGVAILDMQMSKVPIISGYAASNSSCIFKTELSSTIYNNIACTGLNENPRRRALCWP